MPRILHLILIDDDNYVTNSKLYYFDDLIINCFTYVYNKCHVLFPGCVTVYIDIHLWKHFAYKPPVTDRTR